MKIHIHCQLKNVDEITQLMKKALCHGVNKTNVSVEYASTANIFVSSSGSS